MQYSTWLVIDRGEAKGREINIVRRIKMASLSHEMAVFPFLIDVVKCLLNHLTRAAEISPALPAHDLQPAARVVKPR